MTQAEQPEPVAPEPEFVILVNEDGCIIDGNHRRQARKILDDDRG